MKNFISLFALTLMLFIASCDPQKLQVMLITNSIIGTGDVSDTSRAMPVLHVQVIDTNDLVAARKYAVGTHELYMDNSAVYIKEKNSFHAPERIALGEGVMIWTDATNINLAMAGK